MNSGSGIYETITRYLAFNISELWKEKRKGQGFKVLAENLLNLERHINQQI